MKSFNISTAGIIHLFAAAHAATAILCRLLTYYDDVLLTLMSVLLIVIIALRRGLTPGITATLTLIGCFLGYLLGIYGARIVEMITHNPLLAPAITTFCITEVIGWGAWFAADRSGIRPRKAPAWSPSTPAILGAAVGILSLKIFYTLLFRSEYFALGGIYPEFLKLFENTFAILILLCTNAITVNILYRNKNAQRFKFPIIVGTIIAYSALVTGVVYYRLPIGAEVEFDALAFFRLYAIILLAYIIGFTILNIIGYAITSRVELKSERDKKHRAQYQYNKLKQQINPHFLFNSLNILDFLVQQEQNERATEFIRKLAGMYRYMLKNEDETLVPLGEELQFARMYIDLLHERFPEGFTVKIDIPQMRMSRHVIPCCLQLLIENATKHNIADADMPLTVSITADDRYLIVRNNLQPRLSSKTSTGLGLKNIRQQYLDLAGESIIVARTPSEFYVKLPLI